MLDGGAVTYFGFVNTGTYPSNSSGAYASDLNIYIQYSGWTGGSGNFVSDISTLSGGIRQAAGTGTDTYGCSQNQYTFGTIEVTTSDITPSIQYAYSIWIPLAGVGGSMSNVTVDAGLGSSCSTNIGNDLIPDSTNSGINVTVPSGCAIPSGTYRVLWIPSILGYPAFGNLPLNSAIFMKGDTKT